MEYNKAIRDKIPEIIAKSGHSCNFRVLSDNDFLVALEKKLNEEIMEFQGTHNPEELVDVLEVVYAIARLNGLSKASIEQICIKKIKKGAVLKKIYFLKKSKIRKAMIMCSEM